jgi:hypothetical protein
MPVLSAVQYGNDWNNQFCKREFIQEVACLEVGEQIPILCEDGVYGYLLDKEAGWFKALGKMLWGEKKQRNQCSS